MDLLDDVDNGITHSYSFPTETNTVKSGVIMFWVFLFLREAHAPTLLRKEAAKSREAVPESQSPFEPPARIVATEVLILALVRPIRILFISPGIFLLYFYGFYFNFWSNALFTTIGLVFQSSYDFSTPQAGLTYLGLGVGGLISVAIFGHSSNWIVQHLKTRSDGAFKAHFRLPPLLVGFPLASVGLIWYGWGIQRVAHWLIPVSGLLVIGFAMLTCQV
jgi:hypothetical protein